MSAASVPRSSSSAQVRAEHDSAARLLRPVAWRVVAGPPGCPCTETSLEDVERLRAAGMLSREDVRATR